MRCLIVDTRASRKHAIKRHSGNIWLGDKAALSEGSILWADNPGVKQMRVESSKLRGGAVPWGWEGHGPQLLAST